MDSDDEPLATVVVAQTRAANSKLAAFDLTRDDSYGPNVVDEVCDTVPASSHALREAGVHMWRATSHRVEAHDQPSIEEEAHSTMPASEAIKSALSTPVAVQYRFAPLIAEADPRPSRRFVLVGGPEGVAMDSDTETQRSQEVELALDAPLEEMGGSAEPAISVDPLRRRRLVLLGGSQNDDAELVHELRRARPDEAESEIPPEFGWRFHCQRRRRS